VSAEVWRNSVNALRKSEVTVPDAVCLALICFSFGWAYLAMWRVYRGCSKLGWSRANYTQFLSDPRSDDPDELLIWRWTLQLCFAVLAIVLCVLACAFAAK
jgi:hypothetical protein